MEEYKIMKKVKLILATLLSILFAFTGVTAGYYLVKDKDESQNGKNAAYTRFIL